MKHVTYADKSHLIDDDSAEWLMEYARALGSAHMTDVVTLRAIGMDGNEVDATFLLNASTELMMQSAHNSLPMPSNVEAIGYMQERTRLIVAPPPARPVDEPFDVL